jgi:hypothetical protein
MGIPPIRTLLTAALVTLMGYGSSVCLAADGPRSEELAKRFAGLMAERHLDAFAARDPQNPDRYVAAMAFPDVQLLVVAGRSSAPAYLQYQIDQKQYKEAYTALYSNPVAETKLFFQDLGGDGLRGTSGGLADVFYERGTQQTLLDGNWKKAGLSEKAYLQKLEYAETEYDRILTILIDTLTGTGHASR